MQRYSSFCAGVTLAIGTACGAGSSDGSTPPGGGAGGVVAGSGVGGERPGIEEPGPGEPDAESVIVSLAQPDLGEAGALRSTALEHTASSLASAFAVPHIAELGYDPLEAGGLELIDDSELGLAEPELQVLGERGFVIVPRQEFPSFPYGYAAIYAADLPVFISADMVLEAVHRSYESILIELEYGTLSNELRSLLGSMRQQLAANGAEFAPEIARDADLFLTVADSLLRGAVAAPRAPELAAQVREIFDLAMAAAGEREIELFGAARSVDFSQFAPRGHYLGLPELETYFRAMMWLGRLDLRFIETVVSGAQVFRPRQVQAAFALRALMDDEALTSWQRIDRAVSLFVGEHDAMTLLELDELLRAVGAADAAALAALPAERVAGAIVEHQFGAQRIASQIVRKPPGAAGTLSLDASFAFLGQRYTVDSHVFSNVVYDRVGSGEVRRYVPNPLDVAFAALGNDQAVSLLSGELEAHDYAGELGAMRALVDAHPEEYWESSLYTSWMQALRSLSPAARGTALGDAGLPAVARTESWGRRVLGTQLASWAQLRHDTLLYAKQSYGAGNSCEFPDAYVDPYPEFFHGIARFAEVGRVALDEIGFEGAGSEYFERLGIIASRLAEMAEFQRTGQPHSEEHLAFINDAIRIEEGCGSPFQTGWYAQLFYGDDGLAFDPTIADVHTDPGGPDRPTTVLHVATGAPRLMVMTRESCEGPRAYVGIVFAYHERVAEGFTRINDQEWLAEIEGPTALADVPWISSVLPAAAE